MTKDIIEEVYNSMAVIEQLEELVNSLTEFSGVLTPDQRSELGIYVSKLKSVIEVIDMQDEVLSVNSPKLSGRLVTPQVARLKLGGEIIRLREREHKNQTEIAEILGITKYMVSRFFKYFDKASPREKLQLRRTSIFDTVEQLENLNSLIQRTLARLEANNDEINVKVIGEQRQLIQLAANYAEKMANYQRYTAFMETVYEILRAELPDKQAEILKKLSAARSMTSTNTMIEAEAESVRYSKA
jgi:predicted transcriptional regulator